MNPVARAVVLALAMTGAATVGAQGMYRWVDKDGKVHYGDKRPTETIKQLEERKLSGNVIETSTAGFELQQALKSHPVSLYTAPDCKEPCQSARALLGKRGVPFKEIVVTDNKMRDELVKIGGAAEVPLMIVGKEIQKGFEESIYTATLDRAGYPKSAGPAKPQASVEATAKNPPKTAADATDNATPKGKYLP